MGGSYRECPASLERTAATRAPSGIVPCRGADRASGALAAPLEHGLCSGALTVPPGSIGEADGVSLEPDGEAEASALGVSVAFHPDGMIAHVEALQPESQTGFLLDEYFLAYFPNII